jgi:hypothetical protein
MPDFTGYSSGFGTIHLLAETIHLVSVLVSALKRGCGCANLFQAALFYRHSWVKTKRKARVGCRGIEQVKN